MGQRRAKIACSIDWRLLAQVERLRAVTGETRSAVVDRALAKLTNEELRAARVRRYVEAYRETPETNPDERTARDLARRTLSRLPWDDA